jgi:hypothetical protein
MFTPLRAFATVVAATITAGCATMDVSSHVDRSLDFGVYHTYQWEAAKPLPAGDARLEHNPFFQDHLMGAVEKEMAARGLSLARSDSPDLFIQYHAVINPRVEVATNQAQYGYCYSEDCWAGVEEHAYGTIMLDVLDARTHRLIWRAWAQQGVEGVLENPNRLASRIDESVARMFERFPVSRRLKEGHHAAVTTARGVRSNRAGSDGRQLRATEGEFVPGQAR